MESDPTDPNLPGEMPGDHQQPNGPSGHGANCDEGHDEAVRRIEEALRTGAAELDLRSLKLRRVPSEVTRLDGQLTTLRLSYNQLTSKAELADALTPLTQLTTLDLSGNQLTSKAELADALTPLTQLTTLDLSGNQLTSKAELADALTPLTQLTTLRLGGNDDLGISYEIVRDGYDPRRIIRAIEEAAAGRTRAEPEFKVAILGETGAGKTQLRRLLLGEEPTAKHEVTLSFEWQQVEELITKPGAAAPARLHLFDFGGQHRLWGSHRFFLSTRRSIYVICIPLEWSIEKARLKHWFSLVDDLAEQAAREEAARAKDNADERGDTSRSFDELLEDARENNPRPPVIVVVTHNKTSKKPKLDLNKVRSLCDTYDATLIEGYDAFWDPPERAVCVRSVLDAIKEAACSDLPSMQKVWTEQFTTKSLDQRKAIKDCFGFDPTGLNPSPPTRSMTVEAYLLDVCRLDQDAVKARSGREYDLAIDALELLRDLGFAHWLGNRDDLDLLRQPIYSPAWVRQPIYDVLWFEDPATRPLTAARLSKLLRKTQELTDLEHADVIALMKRCDLIFEMEDHDGRRHYLVPDRLDPGDERTLIKDDRDFATSERGYRLDLGYAPDHLMPGLIGRFFARRDHVCRNITRRSVEVDVNGSEARIRIDLDQANAILRVGILADDAAQSRLVNTVQDYVADVLRPRQISESMFLSHQVVETGELVASLRDSLPKLIQEVCDGVTEKDAMLLKQWIEMCDENLSQAGPWKLGILAGVYRVVAHDRHDWHSRHADFVRVLLVSLSVWSTRAGVPNVWVNELQVIAPQGEESRSHRFETTRKAWESVRRGLAGKHPWLTLKHGRAAKRVSDEKAGDIRASGTGRDDE